MALPIADGRGKNGNVGVTPGQRMEVESESSTRGYFISRDDAQAFSLVFDDPDAAVNDFFVYWKNTSKDKDLVISSIGINSTVTGTFKLHTVTNTPSGGSELIPVNLNRNSSIDADATCLGNSAISAVSGVVIDQVICSANGHEEFRLLERLRLGQGDAIGIEFDRGAGNTIVEGVIFGFYE